MSRPTKESMMNDMMNAYETVVEEDGWALFANFSITYPYSRPTMFSHLKQVSHLWDSEKRGTKVYVRPVANWDSLLEESTEDFNPVEAVMTLLRRVITMKDSVENSIHITNLLGHSEFNGLTGTLSDVEGIVDECLVMMKNMKENISMAVSKDE